MNQDIQAYFALVRSDFKTFLRHAFESLNPGTPFLDNWHLDAIVHCLDQGRRGKMRRLTINMPPRHLKSFIVSSAWPAFLLGQDPTVRVIGVSYSDDLARNLSVGFRRIVETDWYQQLFTNVHLTKVTENEVTTDKGGLRLSTSVGGTLTGRGADFIIIDDPIKPEDVQSDKARQGVNDWYRSTLLSRLDDLQRSVLILVMQRLHVNDLSGFVEAEPGFHKLSLPAIACQDEAIPVGDGSVHHRRAGEALHPDRVTLEELEHRRSEVGPAIFNAQYQQAPEAPDGGLFKRKYFVVLDKPPAHGTSGVLFVSIDSASSTSERADYSAISLVLGWQGKFYVLHAERGRWDFEALKAKAWAFVQKYGTTVRPIHFVVENANSGTSLISSLSTAINRGDRRLHCHTYLPRQDKMARAARTLSFFEEGLVVIVDEPGRNAWVESYVNEFLCFPNGRYDDQVDSLVQLLFSRMTLHLAGVQF